MTTPIAAKTYQSVSTGGCGPVSRRIASPATKRLTATRIAASASAARCSAFPWPYGCDRSAGRTATPTARKVSSAATRSVPECTASATRPRLLDSSPAASLMTISRHAAPTETSAVRRCGDMREAYGARSDGKELPASLASLQSDMAGLCLAMSQVNIGERSEPRAGAHEAGLPASCITRSREGTVPRGGTRASSGCCSRSGGCAPASPRRRGRPPRGSAEARP